jgi:hypothetical protein
MREARNGKRCLAGSCETDSLTSIFSVMMAHQFQLSGHDVMHPSCVQGFTPDTRTQENYSSGRTARRNECGCQLGRRAKEVELRDWASVHHATALHMAGQSRSTAWWRHARGRAFSGRTGLN